MKLLGIETSCDETAAAVIEDGRVIHSNIIASQADMHAKFGGIVPELASREHLITIIKVIEHSLDIANVALRDLNGIAVTNGPGLAGSLLVGVNSAKGLAWANDLPLIGINHLEGHVYAAWLEGRDPEIDPGFPLLCLIASGGHTDLILMHDHGKFSLVGRTRDDAAGEAFDKVARVLGLGFPGGPAIQKVAQLSSGEEPRLPRPHVKNSLDFSFSGLKTATIRRAEEKGLYPRTRGQEINESEIANLSGAFQEAIVETMVKRTLEAAKHYRVNGILLGGGVAANTLLRKELVSQSDLDVVMPSPGLCTDNGSMIGAAGFFQFNKGFCRQWDMDVIPNLKLG